MISSLKQKSATVLHMELSAANKLTVASNVIIVLSEATAEQMFGDDLRQKLIWKHEMSDVEETAYAKKSIQQYQIAT